MTHKTIMNYVLFFGLLLQIVGCSKSNTSEFFFGTNDGPDPFVIGTTLSPLKTLPENNNASKVDLPKPQPILTASQMPSRAKKADEILGLFAEKNTPIDNTITPKMSEATGSITSNNKVIDFQKFDAQMNNQYEQEANSIDLLPQLLGTKKSPDPTTREKLGKKDT
jgi:hypothetical protein